jgi:glycogen operon protein
VRVAVRSAVAERVELCLLDGRGREDRVELERLGADRFAADVGGVGAGQRYGLRVHGPLDPDRGLWCDPTKLLLDPYARAFVGEVREPRSALRAGSGVDSAALVPASLVVDNAFAWGDDDTRRPRRGWDDTVVYEVHVRGATIRHPGVPEPLRGTYLGLAHDAFVAHLLALGVTAVELLPVHEPVDEGFLADAGLTNYWGYNPIGFFAPTGRYAASPTPGAQVAEFKAMVATLHRAGIEVLLDVVYNHTAEGDATGPVLSLRGLDAPAYYRTDPAGVLVDTTGCGNSLNARSDAAIELVLASLRYWADVCHVDGFRFDLAPTLGRPDGEFDPAAPLLARLAADPVLSACKLVCEPWDLADGDGYELGRFPAPYREWNGRYRDVVRDFWRGGATIGHLATAMAGSTDLFGKARGWTSSINYVTSHDGFTLRDLVTYEVKRNAANGQDGRDGTDDNRSWNCGVEGETDDSAVRALRAGQVRCLLATLLTSRGVPMLLGGDELGRTQGGNNNAYCQDNATSWFDWAGADDGLRAFCTALVALRRDHPALRAREDDDAHLEWRLPDGAPPTAAQWDDPAARALALRATVGAGDGRDEALVLVNGGASAAVFALPGGSYSVACATTGAADSPADGMLTVAGRSVVVLVAHG